MILRTIEGAEADVAYRADRLETDRSGRGGRFLEAYRSAAENIERFPQMYPEVDDGVPGLEIRNAILERFELRVVYVLRATEAVIVAVVHARRQPGAWHARLTESVF